ncbi:MAG TPA: RdgB/HAM1 family non-canonical purine NTP pyrophosphatase [Vicinamibacterales bacterium]|nr:RdgB/HAM1 family non-canonical purine NTP pyrophosphatase [Vicinamibacterales bacterium]
MTRLLVATTNLGKMGEIREILEQLDIELGTLADHPGIAEADETGSTFAENARMKAIHYARATGLTTVAEDSGLAIDALDGAPGIHSARYNGGTYAEKFAHLFAELDRRGAANSSARFVCALTLVRDGQVVFETQGTVEGHITREPRGTNGFGYDPIFIYPPYGRTLAEVSTDEKLTVSARGKAFRALREYLIRDRAEIARGRG